MTNLATTWIFCVLGLTVFISALDHQHVDQSNGQHLGEHSRHNDHLHKIHEYVKTHQHAKEANRQGHDKHLQHSKHFRKHIKSRENEQNDTSDEPDDTTEQSSATTVQNNATTTEQNNCSTSSGNSNDNDLTVKFNSSEASIYSQRQGIGFLFNFSADIAVVVNETSGAAFVFNYRNNRGASINNLSIPDLLHLGSLNGLLNNGSSFNLSSIPANFSKEINSILKAFNPNYQNIGDFFHDIGRFSNLSQIVSGFQGQVQGGFQQVIERITGISRLLPQLGGNLNFTNGGLDLGSLLNQTNGLGVFSSIIQQLGGNASQVLGPALSSPERFLSIIESLGGRNNGIDSFVRAFLQIVRFLSGNSSGQNLIQPLIQFFGSGGNFSGLPQEWSSLLRSLANATQGSGRNNSILEQLSNGNLSINGTNLSGIFNIFGNVNSSSPIYNIVNILLDLSGSFPPQQSIAHLFSALINLYLNSSSNGNSTLTNLIPSFLNATSGTQFGSSIQKIAGDFIKLFQDHIRLFTDGAEFFARLPLTFFIVPLEGAVSLFSHGNLSLSGLLGSNDGLQILREAAGRFARLFPGGQAALSAANNFAEIPTQIGQGFLSAGSGVAHALGGLGGLGRPEENRAKGKSGSAGTAHLAGQTFGAAANNLVQGALQGANQRAHVKKEQREEKAHQSH